MTNHAPSDAERQEIVAATERKGSGYTGRLTQRRDMADYHLGPHRRREGLPPGVRDLLGATHDPHAIAMLALRGLPNTGDVAPEWSAYAEIVGRDGSLFVTGG